MSVHPVNPQKNSLCDLSYSRVLPRIVRIVLNILGIGICLSAIAIAVVGLAPIPTSSLPWWFNKIITILGVKECIGLILGGYILGTVLAEIGRDPLQRSVRTSNEQISPCQNRVEVMTRIPRVLFSIFLETVLLIPYAAFVLYRRLKPERPLEVDAASSDKPFIVLIHGMNSNSGIWDFGKHFLNRENYGNVITIKLEEHDSVITDNTKGIEDYAQTVIDKLSEINDLAGGTAKFILIGHSMGGLVAGYAAEYLADDAEVTINHIFALGTPWQGSPLFDALPKCIKPKRMQQMTEGNGALAALVDKVSKSKRFYYTFGATTDFMVPAHYAFIDPNRPCTRYTWLGHLSMAALPLAWWEIRAYLDQIYSQEASL